VRSTELLSPWGLLAVLGATCVATACGGSGSSGPLGSGSQNTNTHGDGNGSQGDDGGSTESASGSGSSGNGSSSNSGNGGSSSGSGSNHSSSGSSGTSPSSGSSGSGMSSSGSSGSTTGNDGTAPPDVPKVSGTCPTFSAGSGTAITITASVGTIQADVWGGSKSTGTGGPLIIYWHGTASSPTAEIPVAFNTSDVAADGGLIVGFVESSRTGTPTGNTGDDVWYQSDASFADQVVACAVANYNIDPHRIYTAGYSAGGLQTVYMWYARSGYLASVISYSGGDATINDAAKQDPSNLPPAIVAHGGSGQDTFGIGAISLDFSMTSATWETEISGAGGFYIDCNDGGTHLDFFSTRAPNLQPVAYAFLKAHPFGIKPEPYTTLPTGFPAYCKINGAGTPPA
jgi:hypothetical protein